MRRDVQDARVLVENILGAVAVVHVVIHDHDAAELVRIEQVARGDRDVVQQAEAHAARGRGVMAGRAHERDAVVHLPPLHGIRERDARAGGQQRDLVRVRRDVRVGVETAAAPGAQLGQALQVARLVRRGCLLGRGRAEVQPLHARERAAGLQQVHNGAQAVGALRVARLGVLEKAVGVEVGGAHTR